MLLKSFRYLLLPFSFIYGAIVWLRNRLYDKDYLKSVPFNFPLICVGNLAVGGTGKTPMVEYLVRLLQPGFKTATLSRGYKRKTKGFGIAAAGTTALEIGDEPMQFHSKFPGITVAVGEERLVAIPHLLQEAPETEVIILDDAFQHRPVKAGLNILLTAYKDLYTRDLMLPAGDLRDVKSSAARAEIIIVTKCSPSLSREEKNEIIAELKPAAWQTIYFTHIRYATPYHLFTKRELNISQQSDVLLICGIANPGPLKEYLTDHVNSYDMLRYKDHHIFDSDDLVEIKKQFAKIRSSEKLILTTEKDGVRLQKFEQELSDFPIYVLPIAHSFLFEEAGKFDEQVLSYVNSYRQTETA